MWFNRNRKCFVCFDVSCSVILEAMEVVGRIARELNLWNAYMGEESFVIIK